MPHDVTSLLRAVRMPLRPFSSFRIISLIALA